MNNMLRTYNNTTTDSAEFFIGIEIEHTLAHGLKTLFVVGLQPIEIIRSHLSPDIKHIFFGANHSFSLSVLTDEEQWYNMIYCFLEKGYLCTLDIPYTSCIEDFLDYGLCKFNNFIPQIRIPLPSIKSWNYNTSVKIDDIGFDVTNPGVWVHRLHDLMDPKCFTAWHLYSDDAILAK